MNPAYIQSVYRQGAARGATPVGQVVALYDTILRDFRRASAAFDCADIEARIFEMNHALTVIAELQNTLDFGRGGDAAKRLNNFYELARYLILQANVSPAASAFQRLIDLFTPLRQAWQQIDEQLPVEPPREAAPAVAIGTPAHNASPLSSDSAIPTGSSADWSA